MIQFESAHLLWLLLPLVPFLAFWFKRSYADLSPARAGLALAIRTISLVLIVLALSKPVWMLDNTQRVVLFLVDVSDSVPTASLERVLAEIQEQTRELEEGAEAGLVLFGRHPRMVVGTSSEPIELTPELTRRIFHQREKKALVARIQGLERSELGDAQKAELEELRGHVAEIEQWSADLGTDETDLEAACRLARGLLPIEARRRVMIYSDGNANRGDVLREVAELTRSGVSAHASLLQRNEDPEVIAGQLRLPAEAQVMAPFSIECSIVSNIETKATVKIYRNKYKLEEREMDLTVGRNLLQLDKVRLKGGYHEFEIMVEAEGDTVLENNVARGVVKVEGRPKVLLIEREEREARHLEQGLAAEEIDVEVRPVSGLPDNPQDLRNYDVLILSDVPADKFAPGAMDMVKTHVRDYGIGLIMIGGEQSFGLGGYYRTPIEDALPVKMPIKKNVEKPNLALTLVIDKSGSMSGTKIELAKEAAIASAEVLKGNDRFGVVAFDSRAEWITPITDSSDAGVITSTMSRLVAGGGTNIYPALKSAYDELLNEDAKLKHIILLTDGQTQGSGYDTLVQHIAADGITLSTVGIGDGADAQLLGDMASWGGGEYYFTNDFGSIPQIFTRETMRASKSMLIEEPFVPTVLATHDALKGIDPEAMPFLLGYVATQPKDNANVALVSDYGDPILASWTYGMGVSVAFTSDAKARWAGDWVSWEGFGKFWGQLVRSTMSTGAHKDLQSRTRVNIEQGTALITVDVRDRVGSYRDDIETDIVLLGESDADSILLPVEHKGPGLYTAEFPIERYGEFYSIMVVHKQGSKILDTKVLGVTESYSPEFRTPLPDEEVLRLIADQTGGTFEPEANTMWAFDGDPARTPKDTWWWWLIAAACLLPLDIALRRFGA
ncbi:MAG: VWA domain-containing protein [Planctomycetota bacterium]|nr:VWA domain-containing protein [Planctomycetota bacterium]